MKCLLFAPLDAHASLGRIAALCSTGMEVHLADTSIGPVRFDIDIYPLKELRSIQKISLASNGEQIASASIFDGLGTQRAVTTVIRSMRSYLGPDQSRIEAARRLLNELEPAVAVTYYGPQAIQAAALVKCARPNIPVIDIINLVPSSLDWSNPVTRIVQGVINAEHVDYWKWAAKIDHFVCSSEMMRDYICERYSIAAHRTSILPDYLPKSMYDDFSDVERPPGPPRVIYLGAPERWGKNIDAVDGELLELARAGVVVASSKLSQAVLESGKGVQYSRFTDEEVFAGRLANYAHAFDAAIVTYAVDRRHERFRTTLPTRFFSAITAGLPIAVRAGLFDAIEAYVERHEIGIVYCNGSELAAALSETERMASLRRNAVSHAKEYFAEAQSENFRRVVALATSQS